MAAVAHAELNKVGNAEVKFQAKGPGGLSISGSADGFTAKESGGVLTMSVNLANIKTGIGLRDKHTKKALKADKHPHATMTVKRADLKLPADNKTSEDSAPAKLTVSGTTKPVTIRYKAKRTGSDYHVQGLSTIDYTQFIEEQCYLGVCVDKEVNIKASFKLRD
jgi:polyisoprenoid-binding protein YceI